MIELGTRKEVVINDLQFYIQHMDPFTALHTIGEIQKVASPLIAEVAGVLEVAVQNSEGGMLDKDLKDMSILMPAVKGVFMSAHKYIDGDTLIHILKLLLRPKYISVNYNGRKSELSEDMIMHIFNGDIMSMLELAYHVLQVNYSDFFTASATRFGSLTSHVQMLSSAES